MIVNAYVLPLNDMSIVSINDPLANLENQRNYGCTLLCTSNINAVVSSMSCFVVVHFFIAFTYMHRSPSLLKSKFKWTINSPEASISVFKA